MKRVLYLDTNHISSLARHPGDPAAVAVRSGIRERGFALALSFLHLTELSAPSFVDRPAVGRLLDELPVAWAVHMHDLFDQEIAAAVTRLTGGTAGPPVAFHPDPVKAWGMPEDAAVPPSKMLDALSRRPHIVRPVLQEALRAAGLDAHFKRRAAAVARPLEPLAASILARARSGSLPATNALGSLSPDELVQRAGGLPAFPAYQVFQLMGVSRYQDEGFHSTPNDVVDDLHAVYGAYATVIGLDRRTLGRMRSMKLPNLRAYRRLEDIAAALHAI